MAQSDYDFEYLREDLMLARPPFVTLRVTQDRGLSGMAVQSTLTT